MPAFQLISVQYGRYSVHGNTSRKSTTQMIGPQHSYIFSSLSSLPGDKYIIKNISIVQEVFAKTIPASIPDSK